MSDELLVILLIALIAAIFFFYMVISRKIAGLIFKNLSPTTKNRLVKYYKNRFFNILKNGALAGLYAGPIYSIPHFTYSIITEWINDDFKFYYIFSFLLFPFWIVFFTLFCACCGMLFWLFSDLVVSICRLLSRLNTDEYIKGSINSVNQFPPLFVLIIFGSMIISSSIPDISFLSCLILSGCLELGKKIWQWMIGYFFNKGTNVFWVKYQKYNSIIVFTISIFCVFFSCITGKSIDFAKLGSRMLSLGPLLLFFSFYEEFLKFSFVRKVKEVSIEISLEAIGFSPDKITDVIKDIAPIFIFSSALSFVLTFVLTRNLLFSLAAVVIVILSLKKAKYEWMYCAFGVLVVFTLLPSSSSFFEQNLLILSVSILYTLSFLAMNLLKTIAWEEIELKNRIT